MQRNGLPSQLKNGLVLHLSGDVSGTTAYDASGSGNNGTLVNTPVRIRKQGYAGWTFNGSSHKTTFANKIIPQGAKTIAFNFQSSTTGAYQTLIQNGDWSTTTNGTSIYTQITDGKLHFQLRDANNATPKFDIATTFSVCDGKMRRFECVWDGTTAANAVKIYINGILNVQGTSLQTENNVSTYNLQIGVAHSTANYWLNGNFLQPIITSRVFSAEDARLDAIANFIP